MPDPEIILAHLDRRPGYLEALAREVADGRVLACRRRREPISEDAAGLERARRIADERHAQKRQRAERRAERAKARQGSRRVPAAA